MQVTMSSRAGDEGLGKLSLTKPFETIMEVEKHGARANLK